MYKFRIRFENSNQLPELCAFISRMDFNNTRAFTFVSFSSESKLPSVKSSDTVWQ